LGNQDALSSYSLLLKNNFPDSEEAKLLKQSGLK
jgi:Tfp pilus assembly protein PilF